MRMIGTVRCVVGVLLVLGLAALSNLRGDEGDKKETGTKPEMVPNHIYKHWSAFKVGTTVTRREKVKFQQDSPDGQQYPERTLVKDTTYKLLQVTPEKVIVQAVEMEYHRGYIRESAPVKMIYPAQMKKGLGTPKEDFTKHKQEDVEVKLLGKAYKATLVETSFKMGPLTSTQQIWLSEEVPGGIVKDLKTQKKGEVVVTQSTLEVLSITTPKAKVKAP